MEQIISRFSSGRFLGFPSEGVVAAWKFKDSCSDCSVLESCTCMHPGGQVPPTTRQGQRAKGLGLRLTRWPRMFAVTRRTAPNNASAVPICHHASLVHLHSSTCPHTDRRRPAQTNQMSVCVGAKRRFEIRSRIDTWQRLEAMAYKEAGTRPEAF